MTFQWTSPANWEKEDLLSTFTSSAKKKNTMNSIPFSTVENILPGRLSLLIFHFPIADPLTVIITITLTLTLNPNPKPTPKPTALQTL
jgi:hypothetical protein